MWRLRYFGAASNISVFFDSAIVSTDIHFPVGILVKVFPANLVVQRNQLAFKKLPLLLVVQTRFFKNE